MFAWWFIKLLGCLYVGMIYCQENIPVLADIEPRHESDVEIDLSIDDSPRQHDNDTNHIAENESITTPIASTTTQPPESFACHECTNCNSKSDFVTRPCGSGITMCYKMHQRIDNTSRIIRRGCSTSKTQCTVPNDGQTNSFDSVTCCTSHKCNQATLFQPLFFLPLFTLVTILINI